MMKCFILNEKKVRVERELEDALEEKKLIDKQKISF